MMGAGCPMLDAVLLGVLAQSALVLSGLLVYWVKLPPRFIGLLAGLRRRRAHRGDRVRSRRRGPGAVQRAVRRVDALAARRCSLWATPSSTSASAAKAVGRRWGSSWARSSTACPSRRSSASRSPPPSRSRSGFLMAVFVSNFPQALAPSADLAKSGWKMGKLVGMWALVLVACGVASGLGYVLAGSFSAVNGDRMAALAAGGLLAMIADSMMPFAVERGGKLRGHRGGRRLLPAAHVRVDGAGARTSAGCTSASEHLREVVASCSRPSTRASVPRAAPSRRLLGRRTRARRRRGR